MLEKINFSATIKLLNEACNDCIKSIEDTRNLLLEYNLPEIYTYEIQNGIITSKEMVTRVQQTTHEFYKTHMAALLTDITDVLNESAKLVSYQITLLKEKDEIKKFQGKGNILLIHCPACDGKVSSQAKACPHCGQPLKESKKELRLITCPECGRKHKYSTDMCDCLFPLADIKPRHRKLRHFFGGDEHLYFCNSYDYGSIYAEKFIYEAYVHDNGGDYLCIFKVRSTTPCTFYIKSNEPEAAIEYFDVLAYKEHELFFEILYAALDSYEEGVYVSYEIGYLDDDNKRIKLISGNFNLEPDEYGDDFEIFNERAETSMHLIELPDNGYLETTLANLDDMYVEEYGDDNSINTSNTVGSDDSSSVDPSEWDEESYLRMKGYTVAQNEGLSDEERQHILAQVIDSKQLSKKDIISHLEKMINLRKNQSKYSIAISKWERDIAFVRKY